MTVNHATKPVSLSIKQREVAAKLEGVLDLSASPWEIIDAVKTGCKALQAFGFLLPHGLSAGTPVEHIAEGIYALLDDQVRALHENLIELYQYIDALEVEVAMQREELDDIQRQAGREAIFASIVERVTTKEAAAPVCQEKPALRDAVEKLTDAAPVQSQPKAKGAGHAGA